MKVCHYPEVDLLRGESPVVTLGNFDGVHLGHQRAFRLLKERALDLNSPAVAITFEPHPVSVLSPKQAPKRIFSPTLKQEVIAKQGVDILVIIQFTKKFAGIEAETFVNEILVRDLHVAELVLGANFRFGRGRVGDLSTLHSLGGRYGFLVHKVEASTFRGQIISSSRIREELSAGRVADSATMLGSPFVLIGKVSVGDGRGRLIGFPTANIEVEGDIPVSDGVYVTEALVEGRRYQSMTHIGSRPTFNIHARTVETNLFDFSRDVYGHNLQLFFHEWIREVKTFESTEALKTQLADDQTSVRAFFSKHATA